MLSEEITIIVPCYNEESLVSSCAQALDDFIHNKCIVKARVCFVDDGSIDGTLAEIEKACAEYKDFEYIASSPNKGLSYALHLGFEHCTTSLAGYMDSDLQTNPEDFNLLLELIPQYDMAMGYRASRTDSLSKRFQSRVANAVRRLFTHDGAKDTGCPLKVFKKDAALAMPYFDGYHRFFPALIKLHGDYVQVPVSHRKRVSGYSKFNMFNRASGLIDCFRYLKIKKNS